MAKRTDLWIAIFIGFFFITTKRDRIAPATIEALKFPSVNGQFFRFKVIVFALQRA